MDNIKGLLDQFLGQPATNGAGAPAANESAGGFDVKNLVQGTGGLATGALAGGLAGLLLGGKKPRKIAKTALQVGGVALVGGLAYKAWRNWQSNSPAPASPPPGGTIAAPQAPPTDAAAFLPADDDQQSKVGQVLLRAMITATKADGHISPEEQRKILDQIDKLPMESGHQAFLQAELEKPLDVEAVARDAETPELAAEIYAASLLAIDPSGAAERGYLAMLAARLQLDPALVEHIHSEVEGLTEREAA